MARIGSQRARIGRLLARIWRRLARIGRLLNENLRSYPPLFRHHGLNPQKALRGGIPCPFLEHLARFWSHFVGI